MNRALASVVFTAFMAVTTSTGAAETPLNTSPTTSPTTSRVDFKTNAHPFQLADIGGSFDHLTSNHYNNKAIQDLDQKFQFILNEIGDLEDFTGPFDENIRDPYNSEMSDIAFGNGYQNLGGADQNRQIDFCTSIKMQNFYDNFNKKIDNFLTEHPNYKLVLESEGRKDVLEAIDSLKDSINNLKRLNDIFKSQLESQFKEHQCFLKV